MTRQSPRHQELEARTMASAEQNDEVKEVKISTSTIQTLKVGTPGSNNIVLPGCKILTVNFSESTTADITHLEFCNRYTGSIVMSAKYKIQLPSSSSSTASSFKFEWKKLLTKKLMPTPHFATGAESKFIIKSSEFLNEAKNIVALKIVLQQPSVQFIEFSLENLKVYTANPSASTSDVLSQWALKASEGNSSKQSNVIRDFPAMDKVSLALQKMWALGKQANALSDVSTNPKRFDKDGCYDINLLAY